MNNNILTVLQDDKNFDLIMSTMIGVMEKKLKYDRDALRFNNHELVRNFLLSHYALKNNEEFGVLFLDNTNKLIKFEMLFTGTINHVSVYPRVIIQKTLEYNASALILCHNHPSSNLTPSEGDRLITKTLIQITEVIDVRILDHFIVGVNDTFSMAQNGMMH